MLVSAISAPAPEMWRSAKEGVGVAKDSDKRRVLARRKQELDHAIRHGYLAETINVRVEKLRAAALAVLKKYPDANWESTRARWEVLTADEIVEISTGWGPQPTLRDVQFGGGK